MEIVLAIIGSGALSTLISMCFAAWERRQRRKEEAEKDDNAVKEGTQLMLYDRIKFLGRSYIAEGHISSEDLKDILMYHACYHDRLGGNGYLDQIMKAVKELPIVD